MQTIGYIPGVWDVLHVGHLRILRRAKALCDRLIVGVPSDQVVFEDKGEYPVIPLDHRLEMLESLRFVDLVLPYYKLEFLTNLRLVRPDLLIVGDSWGSDTRHLKAEDWVARNQRRMIKLPRTSGISSSEIKGAIRERATSH